MIKFLNNRNALRKIYLPRLSTNLSLNTQAHLPKLDHPNKCVQSVSSISYDVQEKKNWEEFNIVEYSTLKKYLQELLEINKKKKDEIESNLSNTRKLHQNINDGKSHSKPPPTSQPANKPLPRVLYIQNPVVWLTNKLDFRYLRKWDPNFSETEFTRGARQAVSTITEMLSKNMFDNLKPLLTKSALLSLRKDVEILWADEVRRNIALSPADVQLIIPRKLHFRNISDKKFCDIDMVFIGLKWLDAHGLNPQPPLIFIDIIVRFHRNYSDGIKPDWTISAFKVRRFNIVPQKK